MYCVPNRIYRRTAFIMIHEHQPKIKSHDSLHTYRGVQKNKLLLTLSITLVVMVVEFIGGFLTNSISLISDAGHMFTHVFALLISYAAILCTSIKACHHRTYGFYRAEVLAALFNSLFLFGITIVIVVESIRRMFEPRDILTTQMLIIALLGLVVNLVCVWILKGGHHQTDRNIRSVMLHMFADTGSSVAIVIGAVIISYTGWTIIDPLLSLGIAALIVIWAWRLLKDSVNVLLETAPAGIKTDEVAQRLEQEIPGVRKVEDIHVWEITSNMYSMTAHVLVKNVSLQEAEKIREKINKLVYDTYDIGHTTIQFHGQ